MDLILTSGHRVGSRWIHYLLAELLGKSVYPEVDGKFLRGNKKVAELSELTKTKVIKFHNAYPKDVAERFPDTKVLAIVRNPRDRAVSFAFHYRNHKSKNERPQKILPTDFKAVEYTVLKDSLYRIEQKQQVATMLPNLSTKSYSGNKSDFVWTSYEWLLEDTVGEIQKILDIANINISKNKIKSVVSKNTFKEKSGRNPGQELRTDTWRRKGVNGDWKNWFDANLIEQTEKEHEDYYTTLEDCI